MFLIWEIGVPYIKGAKFSVDKSLLGANALFLFYHEKRNLWIINTSPEIQKAKENRSVTGEGDDAVSYFTNVNEMLRSEGRLAANLINPFSGGNWNNQTLLNPIIQIIAKTKWNLVLEFFPLLICNIGGRDEFGGEEEVNPKRIAYKVPQTVLLRFVRILIMGFSFC